MSEHTGWEKFVSKDCDKKEMIGFDCICYKGPDMYFVACHLSNKQIGHFTGRETVYCHLNSNIVEGVGCPVLAAR